MVRNSAALLILLLASGCSDPCQNTVVDRVDSPDGALSAVMFQRDCGATTGFSTQISIIPKGEQPAGGGEIFRADTDHGLAASGEWGGPWAEMRWLSHEELLVRYADKSRIFEQASEAQIVTITYQKGEPD